MKERRISVIFKSLVIICLLTGIVLNVINTTSITAILSYYTLQSNIICLIFFIVIMCSICLKKNYRNNEIYYLVKGGVVIAIMVTAITYQIALAPNSFQMQATNRHWANLFVHMISPIMVLADYIIFDEKGKFKIYYPIIWLFIPLNYVIYVYNYSSRGGRFFGIGGSREFAYFFLDYNQIGYKNVILAIFSIALCILLLGYLLFFFDKKLKK